MKDNPQLLVPLLKAFYWFDEGLQAYLEHYGWHGVSRPQSMVMVNVVMGVVRPADIARNLGISRQAIHVTIGQLVDEGILELRDDPDDGRLKTVGVSAKGQAMRRSAQKATRLLTAELRRRIGNRNVDALLAAMAAEWGDPVRDFGAPARDASETPRSVRARRRYRQLD